MKKSISLTGQDIYLLSEKIESYRAKDIKSQANILLLVIKLKQIIEKNAPTIDYAKFGGKLAELRKNQEYSSKIISATKSNDEFNKLEDDDKSIADFVKRNREFSDRAFELELPETFSWDGIYVVKPIYEDVIDKKTKKPEFDEFGNPKRKITGYEPSEELSRFEIELITGEELK